MKARRRLPRPSEAEKKSVMKRAPLRFLRALRDSASRRQLGRCQLTTAEASFSMVSTCSLAVGEQGSGI
jgi:hypothetical protein